MTSRHYKYAVFSAWFDDGELREIRLYKTLRTARNKLQSDAMLAVKYTKFGCSAAVKVEDLLRFVEMAKEDL